MSASDSQHVFSPLSAGNLKRIRSLQHKKYRDSEDAFLAEGTRLCEEALKSDVVVRQAVVTHEALEHHRVQLLIAQCQSHNIPINQATVKQFNALSDESSPQGIAFVVQKPRRSSDAGADKLVLAIDRLQDPGNLGTILRTAEWFGVSSLLLSHGCVDPFNPKVVRASMGAIFRLAIATDVELAQTLIEWRDHGWRILGADASGKSILPLVSHSAKDVLVIGNEGAGLSPAVANVIDKAVAIPGGKHGESLNAAVAASIFLYHLSCGRYHHAG